MTQDTTPECPPFSERDASSAVTTHTDEYTDTGIHLHRLSLVIGVPEGECRGTFLGFEPVHGQGCEEVISLTLDGVFLVSDSHVPPFQLFVHEIHDQRVFDGFSGRRTFRRFVLG